MKDGYNRDLQLWVEVTLVHAVTLASVKEPGLRGKVSVVGQ